MSCDDMLETLVFALDHGVIHSSADAFKRVDGLEQWIKDRLRQRGIAYLRPNSRQFGIMAVSQGVIDALRKNGPAYA